MEYIFEEKSFAVTIFWQELCFADREKKK